ncbi:hypothetical protein YA0089_24915 [Pseudomonas viridiflava]|uniref:hypothetical protein n=1 Tax=Pseudomonas viridiflava TaxID=33069 RepID=UPI0018E5DF1B|nr:hypothetical protein [Pseudomonas viridiflava]MBI6726857.1 hypothetical protein [Pseudomonas viridiflava]
MNKPTIEVTLITKPGENAHFAIKHHGVPYGILSADGCGWHSEGNRGNLKWQLFLTPDMSIAKHWDADTLMTYKNVIHALEQYANPNHKDAIEGKFVSIKYISALGFEMYLTKNGDVTYDLDEAEAVTYKEAGAIMKSVKHDMPITRFETDYIVRVQTQDKLKVNIGNSIMSRDVYYEHLLEQHEMKRTTA